MSKTVKILNSLNIVEGTTNNDIKDFVLYQDDNVLSYVRVNNGKLYVDLDINSYIERMINLYSDADNLESYDLISLSAIESMDIVQAGEIKYLLINLKFD